MDAAKKTLRRWSRTARKAALGALCLLGALALSRPFAPAQAAPSAGLNLRVNVIGIALITDLTAATGGSPGTIDLSWTEPSKNTAGPHGYEIRVSTTGQIANNGDFDAAQPLTAFSPSAVPAPGPAGGQLAFVVTGLTSGATHYFAVRQVDLGNGVNFGAWVRSLARNWNVDNFAVPGAGAGAGAITDLTALAGPGDGQVSLSWTAPVPASTSPVSGYTVRYATFSIADVGGSAASWFSLTASSSVFFSTAAAAGGLETRALDLDPAVLYYFAVRPESGSGPAALDSRATGGSQAFARARGIGPVTGLTAVPGAGHGSVALSWTEPFISSTTAPRAYQMRVSTTANIADDISFLAASPLGVFSTSTLPTPGLGGGASSMTITGLLPGVTYYFALREVDASTPTLAGRWRRDAAAGLNVNNFTLPQSVIGFPLAVTDLAAAAGAAEGDVNLSWTAPGHTTGALIASYTIRFATFSVASLGGDTTAWFSLAGGPASVSPASAPGSLETTVIPSLQPGVPWYFAIKAVDQFGRLSLIDTAATAVQASTTPANLPPAVPAGLGAAAGLKRVSLSWTALTTAQKGLDFGLYVLYRSTQAGSGYVQIATTSATSFVDLPLLSFTTYHYRVAGRDLAGLESAASAVSSATPFSIVPMEPFGLNVTASSATIAFDWAPTQRFAEGTLFLSAGTPAADELQGYSVLRATGACASTFVPVATNTVAVTTFTDTTNGSLFYYQIRAFNSVGLSTATWLIDSLGQTNFLVDDCISRVVVDRSLLGDLRKEENGLGHDIRIERRRRPEDTGQSVIQSITWRAMRDGITEIKDFKWRKPVPVVLHFLTSGGSPVPDTNPPGVQAQALDPKSGVGPKAGTDPRHLSAYWDNGTEFKKMYGKVDPVAQTVTVESPNLGHYQIRTLFRADGAVFDSSNLASRVITPNDDGLNDVMIFSYDPGTNNTVVTGKIYDIHGAFVADMVAGFVPNTLTWDGKRNGKPVTSGVYVYQLKAEGKVFNGTIVVAR